jgi:dipeptidyl aminopeptidase/acylaminoacyl peptidase
MGLDLAGLLAVSVYRAFDIDAEGRILGGTDESGSLQLIEIAPDGGVERLTALPGACTGRYLPGERAVVVSHDDGGNERAQLSLLRLPRPGAPPAGLDDLELMVRDPRYVHRLAEVGPRRICYLTNRGNGTDFAVVLRDLRTGAERTVFSGRPGVNEATVSPDGRWLAVNRPTDVAMSDQVLLVDLAGPGEVRAVTGPDEHALYARLRWWPDGGSLVLTTNRGRDFTGVVRYDLAQDRWNWLITDDEHDVTGWLAPDGSAILAERDVDGRSVLAVHDAADGAWLRDVPLPAAGCVIDVPLPEVRWSPDCATATLSISAADMPGDILLADAATGTLRAVTSSVRFLDGGRPARPEEHQIEAADGETIPCFVYRGAQPSDATLAGSAVLVVHGGPESQAKRNFNPVVQALAAAGHTVLVPNVRGSRGYGKRWYSADDGRLRLDSVADLAAIHAYLPRIGADPGRAALWGGSYGGYMVLAGLAFQPDLWAVGVDIVGISSLVTFLRNTAPYRRALREREYGWLERDLDFLREASPLTRIDAIRAPLFIMHGANDPRVPLSEAEQIHAALTGRGLECELLVYGDEGHGLAKRSSRLDGYPKALAFLARHLAV